MNRRDALKTASLAGGAILGTTLNLSANDTKHKIINKSSNTTVVICGGGFAGLTVAKYLKYFNPSLEVLLIEKKGHFVSCPYSNLYLGGVEGIDLDTLSFDYLSASIKYGYKFINQTIIDINRDEQIVTTNQEDFFYDYLVVSSGIEYDYSKLANTKDEQNKLYTNLPSALMQGSEFLFLKKKVHNFQGGNFILNVPSGIYRCPPAPYERACMIANYFKTNKIKAKVILIDPREKPESKPDGFLEAFESLYKEYIVYMPLSEIKKIDLDKKEIVIEQFDKTVFDYVSTPIKFEDGSIIPTIVPSKLVHKANLALDQKGWVLLKEPTFESVSDSKVYAVGDVMGYPYPKSAHIANSCGYIAAKELAYKTLGKKAPLEMPGNICYSLVNSNPKEGLVVYHTAEYKNNQIHINVNYTPKKDKATGESIQGWYNGITSDILG